MSLTILNGTLLSHLYSQHEKIGREHLIETIWRIEQFYEIQYEYLHTFGLQLLMMMALDFSSVTCTIYQAILAFARMDAFEVGFYLICAYVLPTTVKQICFANKMEEMVQTVSTYSIYVPITQYLR